MSLPLLIGNWKMNGSLQANEALTSRLLPKLKPFRKTLDIALCPPSPYMFQVRDLLAYTGVMLGAQDVSSHASGAFTGEVSAPMIKEMGCRFVLIGHSERRSLFHETDELTAEKFRAALASDITPVLCVGETLAEREADQTRAVIERQLQAVIDECGIASLLGGVIAYEPVWAIGTGKTATPDHVAAVHRNIRTFVGGSGSSKSGGARLRILYGGSVKAANAREVFSLDDVDGGLIGGASLNAEEFSAIAGFLAEA